MVSDWMPLGAVMVTTVMPSDTSVTRAA